LLQKDYGEDNDCTLTSITAIVNFLSGGKRPVQEYYDYTEQIAKKYFYRGSRGTPFLTIRKIYHEVLKHFGFSKAHARYLKDVGYKFSHIQAEINKGNPLVLSISNDGLNYYQNHSVTIVGYEIYKINNKKVPMIAIYDNWYKAISYVDYNKISTVSSIHYSEPTQK
jgi:hypothetical protein